MKEQQQQPVQQNSQSKESSQQNCKKIGNHLILLNKLLGSGHYGKVYLAYEYSKTEEGKILTERPLACKIIEREKLSATAQKQVQNEVENLSELRSENVIFMSQSYKTHSRYYIFTELCNGGDLQMLKNARGHLTEEESRLILKQLVSGLKDLFSYDLVHRDLKLANILLHFEMKEKLRIGEQEYSEMDLISMDSNTKTQLLKMMDLRKIDFKIKIADFGFSKFLHSKNERSDTMCGTPLYMAPQLVEDIRYTYKADIWSLGVVFFELLTGNHPFNGKNLEQLGKNLNQGQYILELQQKPSVQCLQTIVSCLQYDEEERASIIDIASNDYLSERYEPLELPNSFFTNRKGSNTNRNSTHDLTTFNMNPSTTGQYRLALNSKDPWLARRLENSLKNMSPTARMSDIFSQQKKNTFQSTLFVSTNPYTYSKDDSIPSQYKSPFKQIQSPKVENFILQEGQIMESSQFLITRVQEFTNITSERVLVQDYFSFD